MRKEKRVDFQAIEAKAGASGKMLSKSEKEIYNAISYDPWQGAIDLFSILQRLKEILSKRELQAFRLYARYDDHKISADRLKISYEAERQLYSRVKRKLKKIRKDKLF